MIAESHNFREPNNPQHVLFGWVLSCSRSDLGICRSDCGFGWCYCCSCPHNVVLYEGRRISVEAQRPSFGLEPTLYTIGGAFHLLRLRNTGAVAKDLSIDVTDPQGTTKWYAPSLSHDAYVLLETDIDEASKQGGIIKVEVNYKDADGSPLKARLEIDFGKITKEGRKPLYQGDSLSEISESLSNIERDVSNM